MRELPDIIGKRLKRHSAAAPAGWKLWQHKTLNIHRGIIHCDAIGAAPTIPEISHQVRHVVLSCLRPSWWRGFGFGAIVSLSSLDESYKQVADLVDDRNNGQGTWQWIVLHFPEARAALGVCTWTEGYLVPVYRDVLAALNHSGFTCESHQRDMDAV